MRVEATASEQLAVHQRQVVYSILVLLVLVGGLFVYKGSAALTTLREVRSTGTFQRNVDILLPDRASTGLDVLARSVEYLVIVGPALLFGILIAGAVRTFVSPDRLVRALGREPLREQLAAGVAGAPLMLCSCCVAPVFSAVHERSQRLGPALAVALAAPSLNPAALALTFMVFQPRVATARLGMGLAAVFLVAPLVARLAGPVRSPSPGITLARSSNGPSFGVGAFLRSCMHVAMRTVPLIVAGVVVSMWLVERLPIETFPSQTATVAAVGLASVMAVPIALPTFFEIPLALTLVGAGAPAGVAAAVLFAGPAVNLPSLATIARSTSWTLAGTLALAVALLACVGGLLVG